MLVHEPTSHAAAALVECLRGDGLVAEILPTPTFALSRKEFDDWAGDRTTFRMEEFYRAERRRFDVLMDGPEPLGGTWNHDHANREPPPRGATTLDVPGPWLPTEDAIDEQVRADLDGSWTCPRSAGTAARAGSPSPPPRAARPCATVLALRARLPPPQRPARPHAASGLVADPRRRHGDRPLPAHGPGGRPRPRLDPPHPAAHVLGNHALQRGDRPAELSDWFREAFVDGFEWVMPPNVVGMSQHADGGVMAARRRRLPVHGGVLGVDAPPPPAAGRQPPHRAGCRELGAAARPRRRAGAGVGARVLLTRFSGVLATLSV